MGQRSQIYVRLNGELVVANYYSWNYGDRMISRARYGIEWILEYAKGFIPTKEWNDSFFKRGTCDFEKFRRIFDVNFDLKDIVLSQDLIREMLELRISSNDLFHDDNNDGKLFISIDTVKRKIKYCFTDSSNELVMDAKEYMDWDMEGWNNPEWKYYDKSVHKTTERNIKRISKMAKLMSMEEMQQFVNEK